jgi:hypothetical protein
VPWRLGPQAAVFSGLLAVTAFIAATGSLRGSDPALPHPSIDETLTRDAAGCASVRSCVWHPLSGVDYTGRLRLTLPPQFGGAITLFIGDSIRLDFEASTPDGRPVAIDLERLPSGPGVDVPPDFWLDDGAPWKAPQEISRVTIDARGDRERAVTLSLGRRAPRVLARLIGYPDTVRAPVCAEALGAGEIYFATGWYEPEPDAVAGPIRRMREHGAVLVSSAEGGAARVRARMAPAVGDTPLQTQLTLRVNDVYEARAVVMRAGFADYEWAVPDAAWVAGTNELLFSVSQTWVSGTRTLGLALESLHVQ